MRIALAADHAGYEFKERLQRELEQLGHEIQDYGTDSKESTDYPDHAIPAARAVAEGKADRAILICTNGIGMAMTANRIPGVRAALVYNERSAAITRAHHDSNALCLGSGEFPHDELAKWVKLWLDTPFDGGRHERRVGKFEALEKK